MVPNTPPSAGTAALFSLGFRPFFLVAGAAAVVLMGAWTLALVGVALPPTHYDALGGGLRWHAHEMLFGYVSAVIAGFLLTSVRAWTGRETLRGRSLAGLVALWFAGRLVPFFPGWLPGPVIALLDLAFLPALALALAIPLLRAGAPRNLVFLPVLGALTVANGLVHAEALELLPGFGRPAALLAVDGIVLLMTIIAGRVIPFFTQRSLPGAAPRSRPVVDGLAFAGVLGVAVLRPLVPDVVPLPALAVVAGVAAIAHTVRLVGWLERRAFAVPLLWILHLGYAWIALGYALTALWPVLAMGGMLGLHAFTAGAMGTLTLGMMARVALGHTGRPLEPPPLMVAGFACIALAGLARVAAPLVSDDHYGAWLVIAGALWVAAFVPFLLVYTPWLVGPRPDGRPG